MHEYYIQVFKYLHLCQVGKCCNLNIVSTSLRLVLYIYCENSSYQLLKCENTIQSLSNALRCFPNNHCQQEWYADSASVMYLNVIVTQEANSIISFVKKINLYILCNRLFLFMTLDIFLTLLIM